MAAGHSMYISSPSEHGLTLTVEARRPGLVLEYLGQRKLRLSRRGEPFFWARVERAYQGLWMARRDRPESLAVIPPIAASEARSIHTVEGWMRFFAHALAASDGSPLRAGDWQLTEQRAKEETLAEREWLEPAFIRYEPVDSNRLPQDVYGLLGPEATLHAGYMSWISMRCEVRCLRSCSESDASRINAWRKHARAQTLPPILLWWIGAFNMHVVLDGHDRLHAAKLEGVRPAVISLWQPDVSVDPRPDVDERNEALRRHRRIYEAEAKLSDESRHRANIALANAFRPPRSVRTSATARGNALAEWTREVKAAVSDAKLARKICGQV
ncbi:MAG: hypothetical protein AAF938_03715 [Myxococcota bacterium]